MAMPNRDPRPQGLARRGRVRERLMARAGLEIPTNLVPGYLDVGGLRRTYWLAPPPVPDAPLLLVLHGGGGAGPGMAALTGLATRGPAAGFAAVFPDGWGRVWNDDRRAPGLAGREAVDDVGFLRALVARLCAERVARPDRVAAVGISNGAFMAEHVGRHGLIALSSLVLIAGGATQRSRTALQVPAAPASVLAFHGTADPLVPYAGGPIGSLGRMAARRDPQARRGVAAPIETVARDWAAVDGCSAQPVVERFPAPASELATTRLTWQASGRDAVVLYRIERGGHTWPGGAQYLPERLVGPVARHLDATGILLSFASRI
ncbi:MAG TPA: esterase [Actinomycetota bacterium]|nr:esterase [Actinomycetota bacterium]